MAHDTTASCASTTSYCEKSTQRRGGAEPSHATTVRQPFLTHVFGRVRYRTTDTSRNSIWLALLTLGEGWHINHHFYQTATRQGFFWWEIDISYYILKLLSVPHIVWGPREPP